jgi:S1-C subfamily serine protease
MRFAVLFLSLFFTGITVFSEDIDSLREYVCLLEIKTMNGSVYGWGSGFVVIIDNTPYVITNAHVVSAAYNINAIFEKADHRKAEYPNMKVFYIDKDVDLAILQFSKKINLAFGFRLSAELIHDTDEVFTCSYPGLGNIPIYQICRGYVSNHSVLFMDGVGGDKEIYIAHTAISHEGSSGSPLLRRLPQIDGKEISILEQFEVVGVTTLKGTEEGWHFALPVSRLYDFFYTAFGEKRRDKKEPD